ncbi:MAG: aminopeptidase [Bacilli bacterium]|nr:aminopeptidase [Bacilli bacterium]
MIKDFDLLKRNYARLIIHRGLNIPKGRIIRITAYLDQPDFIATLVDECYQSGAKRVYVDWIYPPIERIIKKETALNDLKNLTSLQKEKIAFDIKHNVSYILIDSVDPFYLNGLDPLRASLPENSTRAYSKKLRGDQGYYAPYTIASVPGEAWAKRVFPHLSKEKAIEKLWEYIFKFSHVNKNDPFKEWDEHCKEIDQRAMWLNKLNIKSLHYTSKNGTDLTIQMTDKYQFNATADFDILTKRRYYSNIPTEECFVSPDYRYTEGFVVISKPICQNGQMIEGATLRFKKGRIVEIHAKKNERLLKQLINVDEGSHYLGEASLVPYSSLINQSQILFLNTLFDENAVCHFAFGECYRYTYHGYKKLSKDELAKRGLNFANDHVDFMIGTKDLNIMATTKDGKKVPIFKNGEWAK